jgi:hypothetical protein
MSMWLKTWSAMKSAGTGRKAGGKVHRQARPACPTGEPKATMLARILRTGGNAAVWIAEHAALRVAGEVDVAPVVS